MSVFIMYCDYDYMRQSFRDNILLIDPLNVHQMCIMPCFTCFLWHRHHSSKRANWPCKSVHV